MIGGLLIWKPNFAIPEEKFSDRAIMSLAYWMVPDKFPSTFLAMCLKNYPSKKRLAAIRRLYRAIDEFNRAEFAVNDEIKKIFAGAEEFVPRRPTQKQSFAELDRLTRKAKRYLENSPLPLEIPRNRRQVW